MSLVDVSGKNRSSLPTAPKKCEEMNEIDPPWKVGFSETSGNASKLYISQLRLPSFCNSEGLFGLFDGETNNHITSMLVKNIPKILLEERAVKETSCDYMKYTFLSTHHGLKQEGHKSGVAAILCHISRVKTDSVTYDNGSDNKSNNINGNNSSKNSTQMNNGENFILRVASVGEGNAILIRRNVIIKLTNGNSKTKIGASFNYPNVLPQPECNEIVLGNDDEYLVIANKKLWDVLSPSDVACEIRKENNELLACKRLQDVAQSYGAEENLSIIVIKFNNLNGDFDYLMKELRHTMRKKSNKNVIAGFCKCGCCSENSNCCYSTNEQIINQQPARSDRSSPSGQSDQASISDNQSQTVKPKLENNVETSTANKIIPIEHKSLNGKSGIAKAVRARIDEERGHETDSVMSEEQFKCWEYMLEQNTQLLFDK
jgi:PH domain/leucine-rich repeat-containing protein phosphatase